MPTKPSYEESIAGKYPEVAKEWNYELNEIGPDEVFPGTNKKYWWKCDKGVDHIWDTSPNKRCLVGRKCPICSNQKVVMSNCLATTHPEMAEEWHPTLNVKTPYEVVAGSNKKYWWKCPKGEDHEWLVTPNGRKGCPICSNQKIVKSNCLETTHPELAQEWDCENNQLTPRDVLAGANKPFWWKCDKGDDHKWMASPSNRTIHESGCPICSNHKIVHSNCLKTTHPDLMEEWYYPKNKNVDPLKVGIGSSKTAWWQCKKGDDHIYKARILYRQVSGCPMCANKKVVKSNCLATTNPELAKEWHPTKNKKYSPYTVVEGGTQNVWWKCPKGDDHVWRTRIVNRSLGSNCHICANQKVVMSNCLATTHPALAKEWDYSQNQKSPEQVVSGTNKNIHWICKVNSNHRWKASPSNRTIHESGCPFCFLTPQSEQELTITFELITIFKGIDPKGFKTRVNGKLWSIDTYIPSLNVGIEFDGAYWHKDKAQLDKVKTEKIEATGLNLITVRQKPLERLFEDDVMAEEEFDGKQITNDILMQIVKDNGKYAYTLDKRTLNKIDKYISREGLQNEKGLDKYIDQILTEKAERKK